MMIEIRGLCPSIPWGGGWHLPKSVLLVPAWLQGTSRDLQDGCPWFLGGIPASAVPAHCPAFSPKWHVRVSQSQAVSLWGIAARWRTCFSFGRGSYKSRSLPRMGQMATSSRAGHGPSFLQLLTLGKRRGTSQGHGLRCQNKSGQGNEQSFASGRAGPRVTYFARQGKLRCICVWAFGWRGILTRSCRASALNMHPGLEDCVAALTTYFITFLHAA